MAISPDEHTSIAPIVGPDDPRHFTDSGIEIKPLYTCEDLPKDICEKNGEPGDRPLARWKLTAKILQARSRHPEIRAKVTCRPTIDPSMLPKTSIRCEKFVRATILVRRRHKVKGHRGFPLRTLRRVTLRVGRPRVFHVKVRLKYRDPLVVRIAAKPFKGVPKLRASPRTSRKALTLPLRRRHTPLTAAR